MSTSREMVFLDTVGLIAVWNDSDQWHRVAQRAYADLRATRGVFVTTKYVLLECGNAAARTSIRQDVTALRAAPFNFDWGLCCRAKSRHHLETVFEHFTCPLYVDEGRESHSFSKVGLDALFDRPGPIGESKPPESHMESQSTNAAGSLDVA